MSTTVRYAPLLAIVFNVALSAAAFSEGQRKLMNQILDTNCILDSAALYMGADYTKSDKFLMNPDGRRYIMTKKIHAFCGGWRNAYFRNFFVERIPSTDNLPALEVSAGEIADRCNARWVTSTGGPIENPELSKKKQKESIQRQWEQFYGAVYTMLGWFCNWQFWGIQTAPAPTGSKEHFRLPVVNFKDIADAYAKFKDFVAGTYPDKNAPKTEFEAPQTFLEMLTFDRAPQEAKDLAKFA